MGRTQLAHVRDDGWLPSGLENYARTCGSAAGWRNRSRDPFNLDRYSIHDASRRIGSHPIADAARGEIVGSASAFLVNGIAPPSTRISAMVLTFFNVAFSSPNPFAPPTHYSVRRHNLSQVSLARAHRDVVLPVSFSMSSSVTLLLRTLGDPERQLKNTHTHAGCNEFRDGHPAPGGQAPLHLSRTRLLGWPATR